MYAWGPNTNSFKGSKSYDFGSAKGAYDKIAADAKGPRTYSASSSPDMGLVDPRGKKISSDSENPIIVGIDVTGSMSTWPGEIFDRLPLFYQTLGKYRSDVDISFCAIGDATSDDFPLQVNDFGKGLDLEKKLKALYPEGNGGGQNRESYELFGYFMMNRAHIPNAKSPFLIIFGDEDFYDEVNPKQVKYWIGDTLQKPVKSGEIWTGLTTKFDLYLLHKKYGSDTADRAIRKSWEEAIGPQRVIDVPSPERAVDVALGLVAKRWGEYDDFTKNLDARHDDKALKGSVHASLRHVDSKVGSKSVVSGSKKKPLNDSLLGGK